VHGKIKSAEELKAVVAGAKAEGKKVVFTNGCFDLLHRGHLHLLREAKKLGDILIVAINNDLSVKKLKGPKRPILPEADRAELIGALEMVDYVTLFHEADPYHLIKELQPNILVKGGDWTTERIIGGEVVEKEGGRVVAVPYLDGYSTTQMIERMCRN